MSALKSLAWAVPTSLLLLLSVVFEVDIQNRLWILSILVDGAIAASALVLVVLLLVYALRGPRRFAPSIAAMLIVVSWVVSWAFAAELSTDVRFRLLRPYYEAQIIETRQNHLDDESIQIDGRLVAFYWLRGVTDNWVGLVHDPDDALALPTSENAFGGRMIGLRRLDRHWYLCTFT